MSEIDQFFTKSFAGTISTLQPVNTKDDDLTIEVEMPLLEKFRSDIMEIISTVPEEQVIKIFIFE